ncbi:hypothetical protein DZG01_30460 [Pseudomonas fluorescens]|nr:hypothetical protein DZG01_30460 [Pseudomonas fluorescens]
MARAHENAQGLARVIVARELAPAGLRSSPDAVAAQPSGSKLPRHGNLLQEGKAVSDQRKPR